MSQLFRTCLILGDAFLDMQLFELEVRHGILRDILKDLQRALHEFRVRQDVEDARPARRALGLALALTLGNGSLIGEIALFHLLLLSLLVLN